MVELLYGAGLRVRDIDLGRAQMIVRSGKGDKDRVVMLPAALRGRLAEQVGRGGWILLDRKRWKHMISN